MRRLIAVRIASFRYAFQGIATLFRTQAHIWFHAVATIGVIGAAAFFRVLPWEWVALIFAITCVWVTEAMNTALEFLADEVTQDKRAGIGRAKDVAAAAVLLAALGAAIVGCIIFIPRFIELWLIK